MCVCVHVCVYACLYVYLQVCLHVCTHVYECMYVCMYVCLYVLVFKYMSCACAVCAHMHAHSIKCAHKHTDKPALAMSVTTPPQFITNAGSVQESSCLDTYGTWLAHCCCGNVSCCRWWNPVAGGGEVEDKCSGVKYRANCSKRSSTVLRGKWA